LGFALALSAPAEAVAGHCPPGGWSAEKLTALKGKEFAFPESRARQELALSLLDCLASPDPALRDGIAFAALSHWLRAGELDVPTRQAMLARLLPRLRESPGNADGFEAPFTALVLAELARSDRLQAWLDETQREHLVQEAAACLEAVRDYRGYEPGAGWRHGVAHGADLLMQLALNPALNDAQLDRLLVAVASQVAPAQHAYVHGEPERLLRPLLFIAQRRGRDEDCWRDWMTRLAAPAPLPSWEAAFADAAGLARLHNLKAFLFALYANTRDSQQPALQALAAPVRDTLRKLP
jgi:hypothetical protein